MFGRVGIFFFRGSVGYKINLLDAGYGNHETESSANTSSCQYADGQSDTGKGEVPLGLSLIHILTKPIELIEYAIKANQVQADKFNIQIEVELSLIHILILLRNVHMCR